MRLQGTSPKFLFFLEQKKFEGWLKRLTIVPDYTLLSHYPVAEVIMNQRQGVTPLLRIICMLLKRKPNNGSKNVCSARDRDAFTCRRFFLGSGDWRTRLVLLYHWSWSVNVNTPKFQRLWRERIFTRCEVYLHFGGLADCRALSRCWTATFVCVLLAEIACQT